MNEPKSLTTITTKPSVSLTPELRFMEFEENWNEKQYGQIFSFYSTNSFSRDNLNYESGAIKNIHYGDIHTKFSMLFDIEKELVPYINQGIDLSRIKDENYCQEGDLVIADASEDYNDIGKSIELVSLNNEKILAGLHTLLARPNKHKMQLGFSGYLIQSWKVRKQVMTIAQGTKVLGLATTRLGKIKLTIPQLPEQQKIATFLTAIDSKLQQLNTKKTLLEQYKKGVMQQLFSQKLRFKDNDGSDYADWEEKRLGDVGKIVSGLTYSPNDIVDEENGVLVLRSSNVQDGKLSFDDNVYVKGDNFNPVQKEDVLICVRNGSKRLIGKNAIIDENSEGLAFGAFMTVYRSKYNNFLFHYFGSQDYNKEVHKNLGATINSINGSDLKKFKVPFPGVKEQQKIANYLSAIDIKIEAITQQIDKTQGFKKGLLQGMFV